MVREPGSQVRKFSVHYVCNKVLMLYNIIGLTNTTILLVIKVETKTVINVRISLVDYNKYVGGVKKAQ